VETNYLWDETSPYGDVVLEYDQNENPLAEYTLAGGALIAQERGGDESYYLKDGQGSTRHLTDGAGSVLNTYDYTAYGELYDSTGTTPNSYLYTGQQYDSLTGDYYLRARYYDPGMGRFSSRDTWAYDYRNPVELNRYAYGAANPVKYNDPSGHTLALETNSLYNDIQKRLNAFVQTGKVIARQFSKILDRLVTLVIRAYGNDIVTEALDRLFDYLFDTNTQEVGLNDLRVRNAQDVASLLSKLSNQINNSGQTCGSTIYRIQNTIDNDDGGPKKSQGIFEVIDETLTITDATLQARALVGLGERIYVIFDNPDEVKRWLTQSRTSPTTFVFSAKIDRRFVELVRKAAYFQKDSHKRFFEMFNDQVSANDLRHNLPDIADPSSSTLASGEFTSFGIPPSWVPLMLQAICPGTAKITPREVFLATH
jgi:RHS repeat-associated protein